MIERYDVDSEGWDQDKDGDWCMAIEVLAIEEEIKQLEKKNKELQYVIDCLRTNAYEY